MQQVETDEMPANHVHTELLRGFTLNDRLIRPALVMVSKAKEAPAKAAPAQTPSADTAAGQSPDGAREPQNS
jgi:molecular chaperone GrpE